MMFLGVVEGRVGHAVGLELEEIVGGYVAAEEIGYPAGKSWSGVGIAEALFVVVVSRVIQYLSGSRSVIGKDVPRGAICMDNCGCLPDAMGPRRQGACTRKPRGLKLDLDAGAASA